MSETKVAKMNPEIKAEWLRRLRSGEYQQAQGFLQSPEGGYCCLGVLTEQAHEAGLVTKIEPDVGESVPASYCVPNDAVTLYNELPPAAVLHWAEIPPYGSVANDAGHFEITTYEDYVEIEVWRGGLVDTREWFENEMDGRTSYNLAELNDEGLNFEQIATLIEKHF